jgi:large subunit ribosomal protein L9
MKVILRQDYEHLGKAGAIVTVKNGYARNFLIPQGIALIASDKSIRRLDEEQKQLTSKQERDKKNAEKFAEELTKVSITASVQVGEEERVFGSVTSQDIADLLKEKGYEIDRKKILLDEPIKSLGIYDVKIKLHTEVETTIKVWVVKK